MLLLLVSSAVYLGASTTTGINVGLEGDKRVTALYDKPRTPKSRPRDLGGG